jgi:Flp pilus assembly protein TadG
VRQQRTREHGAILIQVAIGMVALMALSALAIDYGVKVASRRAAQNAADAGALAGAIALSFDNPNDKSNTGPAKQSALKYALANGVWGQSPNVNVTTDITFPACPAPGGTTCVRVDVYRNQERGNALPMFFGGLVGVNSQGVKASAIAKVLTGDQTDCLKPWAVIDRWDEFAGTEPDWNQPGGDPDWNMLSTFDRYSTGTGNNPPQENDLYVPPDPTVTSESDPRHWGTGFNPVRDQGRQFAIKVDNSGAISSGWFRSVDLPRVDTQNGGAQAYSSNIVSCNGWPTAIADPAVPCPTDPTQINSWQDKIYWAQRGCLRVQTGIAQGPTVAGIQELIDRDSDASWDPSTKTVVNCASPCPRIVPVGLLDINKYLQLDPSGSGGIVRLVNIFGFFIEGMGDVDAKTGAITVPVKNGKSVVGRLITIPGLASGNSTTNTASFIKTIILVR